MCCVVRACIDAARFGMVIAKVAGSRLLYRRLLRGSAWSRELVQIDVSVRTVVRAESATYTPILNNYFKRIAAAYRTNGAPYHAEGIAALPARGRDQIMIESQTITNQSRDAIMRIGAGLHALIAARAAVQIKYQQTLRVHQPLA